MVLCRYLIVRYLDPKLMYIRPKETSETYRSHILVPRPNIRGIPEIKVGRILMCMWAFGALVRA